MVESRLELARRAAPTATDAELVRAIAAGLIDELGIVEPSVDVEMVASLLGIDRVVADAALPVSGCLVHTGGRFEIRVRASEPPSRQRFTVGHECAHTFFPGYAKRTQLRCSPTDVPEDGRDVESLCDIASSELLMPRRLFAPHARAVSFGITGLQALAQLYEASLEATGQRFIATRPEPAAFIVMTPGLLTHA